MKVSFLPLTLLFTSLASLAQIAPPMEVRPNQRIYTGNTEAHYRLCANGSSSKAYARVDAKPLEVFGCLDVSGKEIESLDSHLIALRIR